MYHDVELFCYSFQQYAELLNDKAFNPRCNLWWWERVNYPVKHIMLLHSNRIDIASPTNIRIVCECLILKMYLIAKFNKIQLNSFQILLTLFKLFNFLCFVSLDSCLLKNDVRFEFFGRAFESQFFKKYWHHLLLHS